MLTITTPFIITYILCWFITNFEPIQNSLNDLLLKTNNYTIEILTNILGCQKCLTFWFSLLITFNPILAMLGSMIAQLHTKLIKNK